MTVGKDVSMLFTDVVNCIQTGMYAKTLLFYDFVVMIFSGICMYHI
jgi:hypothetical protein